MQHKPNLGFYQPTHGLVPPVAWRGMERKTKARKPKAPSTQAKRAKAIWAENVLAIMVRRYPLAKYSARTNQEKALAAAAGIAHASVQRSLDANDNFGIGLDQLADIASALEVPLFQLLQNGYAASLLAPAIDMRSTP